MTITSKAEILDILRMDDAAFATDVRPLARQIWIERGNMLTASSMITLSNVCKNHCLYCGMRAPSKIERYRLPAADATAALDAAHGMGLRRVFFVSGEDPLYPFDDLLDMLAHAKSLGFFVSIGLGELPDKHYERLKEAGADEYVMKFEMSDAATFDRLNPSTDFRTRMRHIERIKTLGFALASGNIIDYPGQTLDMIADDILLMKSLDISWAPVIPYMPAAGTPLAEEGGFGSLDLLYREIAALRLMMPGIHITAQQPGEDKTLGLAGEQGNIAALSCGADILFVDLLNDALVKDFRVIDNRSALRLEGIQATAAKTGMTLSFN